MLTEIVIVYTGELAGHKFQPSGFAGAISKVETRLMVRPSSVFAVEVRSDDPEPQYNKKRSVLGNLFILFLESPVTIQYQILDVLQVSNKFSSRQAKAT